jgi:predicted HTH transcriptional regulator
LKAVRYKIKISQRKIKENIAKLKEKGIIERLGSTKNGHWEVIRNRPDFKSGFG